MRKALPRAGFPGLELLRKKGMRPIRSQPRPKLDMRSLWIKDTFFTPTLLTCQGAQQLYMCLLPNWTGLLPILHTSECIYLNQNQGTRDNRRVRCCGTNQENQG